MQLIAPLSIEERNHEVLLGKQNLKTALVMVKNIFNSFMDGGTHHGVLLPKDWRSKVYQVLASEIDAIGILLRILKLNPSIGSVLR